MIDVKERKTILVVDDTPANIQILVEVLKDEYTTIVATNGEKALRLAAKDPVPDLILLDVMMPVMDGYEACAKLKADIKTRDIPIIFVTAKSEVEDELKGFELGGVDYITKPVSPPLVKARVRTHLALKEAREILARQNEELREAARLREDVENIVRHDLKAPLNSIISLPQIILQERLAAGESAEHLRAIEESGYRMLRMINLSLDLFKMERGMYQFEPASVDVVKIISKIFSENRGIAASKSISLEITLQGYPIQEYERFFLQGEELLCYSMFSNLIKNAIEASPQREAVSVALASAGQEGHISIHNSGVVPEKIRSTFFEKYATAGKSGGTGLGTYSAKLIAETQGGSIAMETSEHEGTTITIMLPLAAKVDVRDDKTLDSREQQKEKLLSGLEYIHDQKILLVDDESFNLKILEKHLTYPKFILDCAENGRDAYEKHRESIYDVIFMDVEMPVMNGIEAVRAIREWEESEKIRPVPVIALSGHDDDAAKQRCAEAGFTGYLIKPAKREDLLRIVRQSAEANNTPLDFFTGLPPQVSENQSSHPEEKLDYLAIIDPDLEELIPSFLKKMDINISALQESLHNNDFDATKAIAHKLKGSFSIYCFAVLSGVCADIENSVKDGNTDKALGHLVRLKDYFTNLRIEYKKDTL
ncbi:MAG: response regulator [Proteobacteria bacterium]|nr:response regulator [Pseudomonadota bacterium]